MQIKLLIILISFGFSTFALSKDYTQEDFATDILYEGQTEVTCKGKQYKIPSYLPNMRDNEGNFYNSTYMNLHRISCESNSFNIEWGIDKGCNGANVCGIGGFYFDKISPRFEELIGELGQYYEKVKSPRGYYIPPRCSAYCSMAKLIWYDDDMTYMLRSKMGEKADMIESANSYMRMIESD